MDEEVTNVQGKWMVRALTQTRGAWGTRPATALGSRAQLNIAKRTVRQTCRGTRARALSGAWGPLLSSVYERGAAARHARNGDCEHSLQRYRV